MRSVFDLDQTNCCTKGVDPVAEGKIWELIYLSVHRSCHAQLRSSVRASCTRFPNARLRLAGWPIGAHIVEGHQIAVIAAALKGPMPGIVQRVMGSVLLTVNTMRLHFPI